MKTPTNCPKCGSDHTQSFAMAHKTGFTLGVGLSSQQTVLAKLTEPPKNDEGLGDSVVLIFSAVVIFNIVSVLAAWMISQMSDDTLKSVAPWLYGMTVGLIATIAFAIWARRWAKAQTNKREGAYKAALIKWQHSWICLQCGNTFRVR